MINLARLTVDEVIIHQIPKRPKRADLKDGAPDPGPRLSDVPSELDDRLRRYFAERLITSLRQEGYPVTFDPTSQSVVPGLVRGFLDGSNNDLVAVSKAMAEALHGAQTWQMAPGLFSVVVGQVDGDAYIAPMKLEHERGLVIEPVDEGGQMTFKIVLTDEVFMTDRTRVFKAGLFRIDTDPDVPDEGNGEDGDDHEDGAADMPVEGMVSDHQTGYRSTRTVARFFLETFLGCTLLTQPELATQDFFHTTERWINREITDPEKKARYEQALIATMNDNTRSVNPSKFRNEHLDVGDRKSHEDALEKAGGPQSAFEKNTKLIQSMLKQVRIDTEDGARLYAPVEMWKQGKVALSAAEEEGESIITIRDKVGDVRGG